MNRSEKEYQGELAAKQGFVLGHVKLERTIRQPSGSVR